MAADYIDKEPVVSVIMGVYNQCNQVELLQAVNSILAQTFKDFEFIIYDDGSVEKSAEYIRNLIYLDRRIRVIRNEENMGLAFSLNQCIGEARGKYLARMDADDISLPDRLKREVDFLERHAEYAWVGSNAGVFDNETIWGTLVMAKEPNQYNFLPFPRLSIPPSCSGGNCLRAAEDMRLLRKLCAARITNCSCACTSRDFGDITCRRSFFYTVRARLLIKRGHG